MDGYEDFLEHIRTGRHPDFGELSWDGEIRQTTISVKFERPGRIETDLAVRERAWRYLRQFTAAEQAIVRIQVVCTNDRPVRAVIEPRSSGVRLGTARLRELNRILEE